MSFPFAKYFGEIRILADLQFQDGPKPFEDAPPHDPEPKDLLLYLGCNVLRTAHLVTTVTAVLKAMGFDFNAVGGPAYCCGIIHHMNGAREASRGYTAGTLRHFAAYRPQQVIMWCPSCNEHYDDVVEREHDVTFPYEHVTAFIARHLDRVRFVKPVTRKVALHGKTSRETRVREIIPLEFTTVTPDDSVEDCMRVMTEKRIRHLPVVEGSNVVGIVSIGDLVNWIISTQDAHIQQMEQYITGSVSP